MEQLMCYKLNIHNDYPKLKIFKNGKPSDFTGPHFPNPIVKHLKTEAGLLSKELDTIQETENFINNEESSIIGFFSSLYSNLAVEFHKQVEFLNSKYRFAHTDNPELITKYDFNNTIVLFQSPMLQNKFESHIVAFEINETTSMGKIIEDNYHGLVGYRSKENAHEFMRPTVIVYYDVDFNNNFEETHRVRNRILKIAKQLKSESINITFSISNPKDFHFEMLRLESNFMSKFIT